MVLTSSRSRFSNRSSTSSQLRHFVTFFCVSLCLAKLSARCGSVCNRRRHSLQWVGGQENQLAIALQGVSNHLRDDEELVQRQSTLYTPPPRAFLLSLLLLLRCSWSYSADPTQLNSPSGQYLSSAEITLSQLPTTFRVSESVMGRNHLRCPSTHPIASFRSILLTQGAKFVLVANIINTEFKFLCAARKRLLDAFEMRDNLTSSTMAAGEILLLLHQGSAERKFYHRHRFSVFLVLRGRCNARYISEHWIWWSDRDLMAFSSKFDQFGAKEIEKWAP